MITAIVVCLVALSAVRIWLDVSDWRDRRRRQRRLDEWGRRHDGSS